MPEEYAGPVTVAFAVTFDFSRFYTEAELAVAAPELLDDIRRASTIDGSIDIESPGRTGVRVADELVPCVQNLCFRAVATLSTGNPAEVPYFARQGLVSLTPVGDETEIAGDRVDPARYPTGPLCAALVACGERFLDFARTLKSGDGDYLAAVEDAAQYGTIAEAGLVTWEVYD